MTGPVRWLTAPECAAYERRALQYVECGIAAAPPACTSILLACRASLLCVTVWLPPRARWLSSMADVLDTLQHGCLLLRSLHLRNFVQEHADGAEVPDWPEHALLALEALLRTRRLRNLSLKFLTIPVRAMAVLGEAAGETLRSLRYLPESYEHLRCAPQLAASLRGLRLLGSSWHLMPRLLPAFLATAPALVRLECQWVRRWDLPRTMTHVDHAALVAQLTLAADADEALDGDDDDAGIEMQEEPAPGEVDACLLALAHVLARCAAEAGSPSADEEPAPARPIIVVPQPRLSAVHRLSAAGIAAAQRVYPALTVDADEEAYEHDEHYM